MLHHHWPYLRQVAVTANQPLRLADGLYPLSSKYDPEYASVRDVVSLQLKDLVRELGTEGGLVFFLWVMLLGCPPPFVPVRAGGIIDHGRTSHCLPCRFLFGMDRRFVGSADGEQGLTNFRTMADYITSMQQTREALKSARRR